MSRVFTLAVCMLAALYFSCDGKALGISTGSPAFVTKDFAVLRKAPGAGFPLLTVVPPSAAVTVNSCSTYWSVGWCEVTYQGWTGSMRSSLIEVVGSHGGHRAKGGRPHSGHGNALWAEKNYLTQQRAFEAAREKLRNLRQTEARKEKRALAHTGQWIEPHVAWLKQVALQRKVSRLGKSANRARAQFFNAEISANSVAPGDKPGRIWSAWLPWH